MRKVRAALSAPDALSAAGLAKLLEASPAVEVLANERLSEADVVVLAMDRFSPLVGSTLRAAADNVCRRVGALCELCHSARPADVVRLYVARKAGAAGRLDNTVGVYACADLACSLYVRGRLPLEYPHDPAQLDQRVEGLCRRLNAFDDRMLTG